MRSRIEDHERHANERSQAKGEICRVAAASQLQAIHARAIASALADRRSADLQGVCASSSIDGERMSFARGSLSWLSLDRVPVYLKH
jgi:stage V sporulation protein SpoVS